MHAERMPKSPPNESETLRRHYAMYERRLRELARMDEVDDAGDSALANSTDEDNRIAEEDRDFAVA